MRARAAPPRDAGRLFGAVVTGSAPRYCTANKSESPPSRCPLDAGDPPVMQGARRALVRHARRFKFAPSFLRREFLSGALARLERLEL